MASISPPTFPSPSTRSDSTPHKFTFPNPRISPPLRRSSPSNLNSYSLSSSHYLSRFSDSTLCRCNSKSSESDSPSSSDNNNNRWDSVIQDVVRNAIKRFNNHMSSYLNQSKDEEKAADVVEFVEDADEVWDWDRWSKHFNDVDEQERILAILKAQLAYAVGREDYEDASRLKVAIAAAATNDTVGRVMYHLDRAIKEERYRDAALIRDSAGAGLVSTIPSGGNGFLHYHH